MKRHVERSQRAVDDLLDHYEYIYRDNPAAAERLLDAAEEVFLRLGDVPGAGRAWNSSDQRNLAGVRVILLPKPFNNYLVFYRRVWRGITILAVLHAAQDLPSLFG